MRAINQILTDLYNHKTSPWLAINILLRNKNKLTKVGFDFESYVTNLFPDTYSHAWVKNLIHFHESKIFDCQPLIKRVTLRGGRLNDYIVVNKKFPDLLTAEEIVNSFKMEYAKHVKPEYLKNLGPKFNPIIEIIDTHRVLNS